MNLLEEYAKLAVSTGINVVKDEYVIITVHPMHYEFADMVSKYAYEAGAKKVIIKYRDDFFAKLNYTYQSIETLEDIPNYLIEEAKYLMDKKVSRIALISPIPGLMEGVDVNKLRAYNIASSKALNFYQEFTMANNVKWTVLALPNKIWAKKVFPNLEENEAYDKLLEAILMCSRVDGSAIDNWKKHASNLKTNCQKLNDYNFKELKYYSNNGTNFTIGLAKNHIWCGGEEECDGCMFEPNIPSEEIFTMPDKLNCNGVVYSTKPLLYNGVLIEDFKLVFKDGKVVEFDALKNKDALNSLLTLDEGSSYLGEVALVPHSSMISKSGVLFYNTLFDENASCHLAFGQAYPTTIKNFENYNKEELVSFGMNESHTHVDFMIGTSDLSIIGVTFDGKEIKVFENGEFVI